MFVTNPTSIVGVCPTVKTFTKIIYSLHIPKNYCNTIDFLYVMLFTQDIECMEYTDVYVTFLLIQIVLH